MNVLGFSYTEAALSIFGMFLMGVLLGLTFGLFRALLVGYIERKD